MPTKRPAVPPRPAKPTPATTYPKRRRGRPRTGLQPGELASEYERMTLRLPRRVFVELDAMSKRVKEPRWYVVYEALREYFARHAK